MSEEKVYRLSDEVIVQMINMIQLSMLQAGIPGAGETDIGHQFRSLLMVENSEGKLVLNDGFKQAFEQDVNNLNQMISEKLEEISAAEA